MTETIYDAESWKSDAPNLLQYECEPFTAGNAHVFVVNHECALAGLDRDSFLPRPLRLTDPFILSWLIIDAEESDLGRFAMAQARVVCRSGPRPRAFVTQAIVDDATIASELAQRWGLPVSTGSIRTQWFYDEFRISVSHEAEEVLFVQARDPMLLSARDLHWTSNLHIVGLPDGPKLVQFDPEVAAQETYRFFPYKVRFQPSAWRCWGVTANKPIAAVAVRGAFTIPAPKFAVDAGLADVRSTRLAASQGGA